MDRIALRRVRAYGRHGWNEGEREAAQPFEIDLDVEIDLRARRKAAMTSRKR